HRPSAGGPQTTPSFMLASLPPLLSRNSQLRTSMRGRTNCINGGCGGRHHEAAIHRAEGSVLGKYDKVPRLLIPAVPDSVQFEAFQDQRGLSVKKLDVLVDPFLTELDDRPETCTGTNRQPGFPKIDRPADKRPVAADFDGVAVAGAQHRFGQGLELALLSGRQDHEEILFRIRACLCRRRLRFLAGSIDFDYPRVVGSEQAD